jgi:hypothetical protein
MPDSMRRLSVALLSSLAALTAYRVTISDVIRDCADKSPHRRFGGHLLLSRGCPRVATTRVLMLSWRG